MRNEDDKSDLYQWTSLIRWKEERMRNRYVSVVVFVIFLILLCSHLIISAAQAEQSKIEGTYCYQYGDSESLMMAKEISYAMALRKAIESYKTFVSSTSIVEDFQLKKDIIEAIASGYVDNIQIVKQDVNGRTVCTSLVGYVEPDAVKNIVMRKVDIVKKAERKEFEGLVSNKEIKILNVKRFDDSKYLYDLHIIYQVKTKISGRSVPIIVDLFDRDGNQISGMRTMIPEDLNDFLYKGEVRTAIIRNIRTIYTYRIKLVD